MRVLVINPGGTSTKISIFEDKTEILKKSITHTREELKSFKKVFDEGPYRKKLILDILKQENIDIKSFDTVVGRGGLMKPIEGGTYKVNDQMIEDLKNEVNGEHASYLGAVLAKEIGDEINVESFVVDPVSVDEFQPVSRFTGISDIEKASWLHALNHKAVSRKVAESMGGKYEDYNFIVAHLGSGISIVAHKNGKMIDGSGGRSDGPFSPERCGGLLAYPLIELCYSGKYTREELVTKVSSAAGMYDYLGTKDMIEIQNRVDNGDKEAKLVVDAFIYQTTKEIWMYAASLEGKVDKIILTGGIAYSENIVHKISENVSKLANVAVIPGEMEMEALALGALRVLSGEEKVKVYR